MFLKVVFILANSADPNGMWGSVALHLRLHCNSLGVLGTLRMESLNRHKLVG